jgi:hypothetical protein
VSVSDAVRRGRHELSILTLIVAGTGCATLPAMSDPSVQIVPGRLAAFPSYGGSFLLGFAGPTFQGDQSVDARKNVDDAINYRLARSGGHSFLPGTVAALEHATEFFHWSHRMLSDVTLERVGSREREHRHRSVADWRFPRNLASWRTTLSADFVLVSMFYEGTDTVARAAMPGFAGGKAARRAISCVVQLDDGRVVWCQLVERFYSDLGSRAGAQELVDKLLRGLPVPTG